VLCTFSAVCETVEILFISGIGRDENVEKYTGMFLAYNF